MAQFSITAGNESFWLDCQDVALALQMRANFIETGDVALSANDCVNSKQPQKIKALSDEQRELVRKLRKAAENIEEMI